jgi:hypothetical protein
MYPRTDELAADNWIEDQPEYCTRLGMRTRDALSITPLAQSCKNEQRMSSLTHGRPCAVRWMCNRLIMYSACQDLTDHPNDQTWPNSRKLQQRNAICSTLHNLFNACRLRTITQEFGCVPRETRTLSTQSYTCRMCTDQPINGGPPGRVHREASGHYAHIYRRQSCGSVLCYITRLIARHLIRNAAATPTAIPSASFGIMPPSPLYTDPTIGILFTIPVDRKTKAVPAGMKIASRCDVRVMAKWTKKERAKWRKASRLKVSRPMKKLPFSMTSSTSSCDGGLCEEAQTSQRKDFHLEI